MWKCRLLFTEYTRKKRACVCIQRAWRRFVALQRTRALIDAAWQKRLGLWREKTALFCREWSAPSANSSSSTGGGGGGGHISSKRRVVIHCPSLSLQPHQRMALASSSSSAAASSSLSSFNELAVRQNAQMGARIAESLAADPLVDVVYIAPFHLAEEVLQYW